MDRDGMAVRGPGQGPTFLASGTGGTVAANSFSQPQRRGRAGPRRQRAARNLTALFSVAKCG